MRQTAMNCHVCGGEMLPQPQWKRLSDERREQLRREGWAGGHQGRGLCTSDYARVKSAGMLIDFERHHVPWRTVLEEWQIHADNTRPMVANISNLAPRLGMTEHALEQAVTRLRRRGLIDTPLGHAA